MSEIASTKQANVDFGIVYLPIASRVGQGFVELCRD
jgi:hypothetical protein